MAGSGSTQALVATFVFGIVVLAATAVIVLFVRGHGSTFFRDELRLALTFFLITSALWGLLGFIATLVNENAPTGCQVVIAFGGAFDQLARIALEQFLLWGIHGGLKLPKVALVLQGALFLRFIFGAVFVGVQRPQFSPKCVASNLVFPIGIAVVVIDALMVVALAARAYLLGQGAMTGSSGNSALLFITIGVGIWTGMSVPFLLGLKSTAFAVRTIIPAIGLLILMGVLVLFAPKILVPKTPVSKLIRKSPSMESAQAELPFRGLQTRGVAPPPPALRITDTSRNVTGTLPLISQAPNGQAVQGVGGVPVEGKLFPPVREHIAMQTTKKYLPASAMKKGGKIVISNPMVNQNIKGTAFEKISTVDLGTAVMQDKERRDMAPRELLPKNHELRAHKVPQAMTPEELMSKLQVSKRKQVPNNVAPSSQTYLTPEPEVAVATTSAVQLSPGIEETRRRSPRHPPPIPNDTKEPLSDLPVEDQYKKSTPPPLLLAATVLSPPPKSPKRPRPISPLNIKSPKSNNAETRSLLDPRTPPAIPSKNIHRPESKIFETVDSRISTATLSPLVPRVKPSSIISVEKNPKQVQEQEREPDLKPLPELELVMEQKPDPAEVLKPVPQVDTIKQGQLQTGFEPHTALLPRSLSVKNNIRPSRQRPPSVPPEEEKPAKTPVQMRATAGLPRNPKARATRILPKQQNANAEQAVMFINDPNDPADSSEILIEEREEEILASLTGESVLHRPRPVRRRTAMSASVLLEMPVNPYSPETPEQSQQPSPRSSLVSPTSIRSASRNSSAAPSPVSPSRRRTVRKNSLVPELPALPAEYEGKQPKITQVDTEGAPNVFTAVPNAQEYWSSGMDKQNYRAQLVSKFSVDTTLSLEEPQSTYNRLSIHTRSSYEETIGRSSVVFATGPRTGTDSNIDSPMSIPPEVPDIPSSVFTLTPKATPTQTGPTSNEDLMFSDAEFIEFAAVPIMLDTEISRDMSSQVPLPNETRDKPLPQLPTWHHRIGDELPGFLSRRSSKSSSKLLPPRPLALERSPTLAVIVEAEPSPLESPQEALNKIQEQLRQLDVDIGDARATISEKQRMTILANLESEMGLQETQWQRMRQDLARGSPSTIASTSHVGSTRNSFNPGVDGSLGALQDQESNKSLRNENVYGLNEGFDDRINHQSIPTSSGMSYLSVTNPAIQLGSPTPPHTDESDNGNNSDATLLDSPIGEASPHYEMGIDPPTGADSLIIGHVLNSPDGDEILSPESIRFPPPVPKKDDLPGDMDTEQESRAPIANVSRFSLPFSMQRQPQQQQQQRVRPLTQRPPRRSKRISLLPDIVENPEPMVGKRDTLGIFQFPWGERSDSATAQPSFIAIPGTMSSGHQYMNPSKSSSGPQIEQQNSVFESSSDYEYMDSDEEDEDIIDDFDDDFDETTLWEIASLLKTNKERGRDGGLMPTNEYSWQMPTSNTESREEESPSEDGRGDSFDFIPLALAPDIVPALKLKAPVALWVGKDNSGGSAKVTGLAPPEAHVWRSYIAAAPRSIYSLPRYTEPAAAIASFSLWTPTNTPAIDARASGLWKALPRMSNHFNSVTEVHTLPPTSPSLSAGTLWSPPSSSKGQPTAGLPQPDAETWASYIPPSSRLARSTTLPSESTPIISQVLWSPPSVNSGNKQSFLWCRKQSSSKLYKIGSEFKEVAAPSEDGKKRHEVSHSNSWMQPSVSGTASIVQPTAPPFQATAPGALMFTADWLNPSGASPNSLGELSSDYSYDEDEDEDACSAEEEATDIIPPHPVMNRRTLPVFMTHDQWNSAFNQSTQRANSSRNIVGEAAWATEDEWAATISDAANTIPPADTDTTSQHMSMQAAMSTLSKLSSSHAMKDHPFFDPTVMALVSENIPSSAVNRNDGGSSEMKVTAAEPTNNSNNGESATPAAGVTTNSAATNGSNGATETSAPQPATDSMAFWTRLFPSLPKSSSPPSSQ